MNVEILNYQDHWQEVKNAAMNTVGKETGKYPSSTWKSKILRAEHSPIRYIELTIRIHDIPYWVAMHLVRHHIGVTPYVSTERTDRTGIDRNNLPQNASVCLTLLANAQALINISRKRLCSQAANETRGAWRAVVEAVRTVEPELADCMVPECEYRGFCPEMRCCGFIGSENYKNETEDYRNGFKNRET